MPMKPFKVAKSRLRTEVATVPQLPPVSELAKAFFRDVIAALQESPSVECVVVVGDDADLARQARRAGAMFLSGPTCPAEGPELWAELNAASQSGFDLAFRNFRTEYAVSVAGDLASLKSDSITTLFRALQDSERGIGRTAFVRDRSGHGTTLLAVNRDDRLLPQFGKNSAAAHSRAGAVDLTDQAPPDARLDIDTFEDLKLAIKLGVGPHTAAVLDGWGLDE